MAEEVHGMSRQLHSAIRDDLGLEAALREQCISLSKKLGFPVKFDAQDLPRSVAGEVSLCLFRVAQVSLRNIAKHSGAKKIRVRLANSKELSFCRSKILEMVSIQNYPDNANIRGAPYKERLAQAQLGQVPQAVDTMNRVVKMYPDTSEADNAKVKIRELRALQQRPPTRSK